MLLAQEEAQNLATDAPGYIGRIPVRNLWLLMLYASDLFRVSDMGCVALEANQDEIPDLVAEILVNAVEVRLRRHLSPGYRPQDAWLNRVRGRIDLMSTERYQLLKRGLVACKYEELTVDTQRNRFVCVALESISRIVKSKKLSHRCRSLASCLKLAGVSGQAPTLLQMNSERFGRHDMDDRHMVAAAKLAFELLLPTEMRGTSTLPLPEREITWVRRLYERAIGRFYEVVLRPEGWSVKCGGHQQWQIEDQTEGIQSILPEMRTDIVLEDPSGTRRIVIDTKFNSILSKGWYREESLRSGYIYQMYAYLRSQVGAGDFLTETASGLLLHPAIGEMIDESVVIQGHRIRFATVDLAVPVRLLRARLLQFAG